MNELMRRLIKYERKCAEEAYWVLTQLEDGAEIRINKEVKITRIGEDYAFTNEEKKRTEIIDLKTAIHIVLLVATDQAIVDVLIVKGAENKWVDETS